MYLSDQDVVHFSDPVVRPYLSKYKSVARPALPWPALFIGRYLMPYHGSGQHKFIMFLLAADGIIKSVCKNISKLLVLFVP